MVNLQTLAMEYLIAGLGWKFPVSKLVIEIRLMSRQKPKTEPRWKLPMVRQKALMARQKALTVETRCRVSMVILIRLALLMRLLVRQWSANPLMIVSPRCRALMAKPRHKMSMTKPRRRALMVKPRCKVSMTKPRCRALMVKPRCKVSMTKPRHRALMVKPRCKV